MTRFAATSTLTCLLVFVSSSILISIRAPTGTGTTIGIGTIVDATLSSGIPFAPAFVDRGSSHSRTRRFQQQHHHQRHHQRHQQQQKADGEFKTTQNQPIRALFASLEQAADNESNNDKGTGGGEISFFYEASVYVRAGSGGQGSSTYKKAKKGSNGIPDGGSGGTGGNVVLICQKRAKDNLNRKLKNNSQYPWFDIQ